MKKRIVIFASGNGTNTQNIIQYFQQSEIVEVVMVLTNNQHAKVLDRAQSFNIPAVHFTKSELSAPSGVLETLQKAQPDLIVLAGFLLKFPKIILDQYEGKVINIHPALLPKYGGKGMYGKYVHEAVIQNKEQNTGITIHYVNEHYDEGAIIFQAATSVSESDTPDDVAEKVHALEKEYFPKIIEAILSSEIPSDG